MTRPRGDRPPTTRWSGAGLTTLAGILALAGCASPSTAQVEERFLIEYAAALEYPIEIVEGNAVMEQLAQALASDAASGACGDDEYYATLEGDVEFAFAVTCSMYYEHQLSDERAEWVESKVIERATEDADTN